MNHLRPLKTGENPKQFKSQNPPRNRGQQIHLLNFYYKQTYSITIKKNQQKRLTTIKDGNFKNTPLTTSQSKIRKKQSRAQIESLRGEVRVTNWQRNVIKSFVLQEHTTHNFSKLKLFFLKTLKTIVLFFLSLSFLTTQKPRRQRCFSLTHSMF